MDDCSIKWMADSSNPENKILFENTWWFSELTGLSRTMPPVQAQFDTWKIAIMDTLF